MPANLKNITSHRASGPGGNHVRNRLRGVAAAGLAALLMLMVEPQMQAAWVPMTTNSAWPITADYDRQNNEGYPCRIYIYGGVQPGNIVLNTIFNPGVCAVSYGGKEVDSAIYDLWVDD